jgi:hypothetical protein
MLGRVRSRNGPGQFLSLIAIAAALGVGVVTFAARVNAQSPPGAREATQETGCGAQINAVTMTNSTPETRPGTTFRAIPFMYVNLPTTPGDTNCILLTFSGESRVSSAQPDAKCYVRGVVSSSTMLPRTDFRVLASARREDSASLWQWSHRVTATGNSVQVKLQWRSQYANDTCSIANWQLTAQQFD